YWRMQTPSGEWFGHRMWVDVVATDSNILAPPTPPSAPTSPIPPAINTAPSADRAASPVVVDAAVSLRDSPCERFREELEIIVGMGFNARDVMPLLEGHIHRPASEHGNVDMADVQQLLQTLLDLVAFRVPT